MEECPGPIYLAWKSSYCQTCGGEIYEEWLADNSNQCVAEPEPEADASPKAKSTGPGTADPGKFDLKFDNTLEEWLVFVTSMKLKRRSVVDELHHLGESSAASKASSNLDLLEVILKLGEDVLRRAVVASPNLDTVHDLSDFLAYLREFRKVFNETIADIELLVRTTCEVSTSCPIVRMLEADPTATWPICE